MKKEEFIKILRKELKTLSNEDIDDIIQDYEEHFAIGKKKKRSEENVAKSLGDPKTIAKQLRADYHIKKAEEKTTVSNVFRAILATLGLGLFNIIVVLGPVLLLFALIILFFAVAIILSLVGVALSIAGIVLMIMFSMFPGLGFFFLGISIAILGILLFIGMLFVTKYFFKALLSYMKMNIKIITGEKE